MSTFTERFNEAFKKSGLSQHQLADLVKVSQPAIKKLVSGETKSFRKIAELSKALNVDINWLSTGKSDTKSQDRNKLNLAQRIKLRREKLELTQEQLSQKIGSTKELYEQIENGAANPSKYLYEISVALECDMAWLLSGKNDSNVENITLNNNRRVPVISFVQAGVWTESCCMEDSTGFEYLQTDLDLSESSFALKIKGRSMEPDFVEGDMIIIDPTVKPMPGDFVAAVNGEEEATFKKYREIGYDEYERMQFELVPLNNDFPIMTSLKQQIRIVGTMIEHRRYRHKR
ncbi:SOS-response transcriptional repressor LexA [Orbus hercynius]|uniref:SOS-response transcriptional repressor LexA n=1 Tax=Orbus hercynius TaxID=593135 RepID=A0A495RIW8_9GAMM|nr:helix-turn-helix domain-containing protein [Orbus hercynius]RKS87299.1 SOS-response transcriptional repressor LexA [Orbus hercynius]